MSLWQLVMRVGALLVLDWGGDGRPLVLLAGLGTTAQVSDEVAVELTGLGHV